MEKKNRVSPGTPIVAFFQPHLPGATEREQRWRSWQKGRKSTGIRKATSGGHEPDPAHGHGHDTNHGRVHGYTGVQKRTI
ncbi:hypothetical protein BC828DRAFT_190493 [Blastocladiella britannica]|nr:hypothetical protein BC828DRAFT_190493 [Blastocladiella britannica]